MLDWSVQVLAIATSLCLDEGERVFHGLIDVLISLSYFFIRILLRRVLQCLLVRLLILMSASSNVILFFLTELGDVIAS